MAYSRLETESSLETDPSVTLRSDWPTEGHIELNDLSYRHSNEGPFVLRGIRPSSYASCCSLTMPFNAI